MTGPPRIDAEGFLASHRDKDLPPTHVAQQIADACKSDGCFLLLNSGISLDLIARLQHAMRDFFALPLEKKLKVKRTPANPNGFYNDEYTKQKLDLKEGFDLCHEIGAELPGFIAANQWPEGEDAFKSVMSVYLSEMERASFKLLQALSIGLGLEPNALLPLFEDSHTSFLRLNYYPPTPRAETGLGISHHTDAGFLTILLQDEAVHCLEFFKDGTWHDAAPIPDSFTINLGDQAQVLSNDLIHAPLHRVRSPHGRQGRYSVPFFFNPRPDAVIAPLPAFVTPQRPAAYRPIKWREFRALRFAGDYADLGEEVQISHYRI